MIDPALALIIQTLNEHSVNALLIIDEHSNVKQLSSINKPSYLTVLTQRYEQHRQLQKMGFTTLLSDYDLSPLNENSYEIVAMRIGKQKAISHHIINQAARILSASGQLILAGCKQEGLQSIAKKLKAIAPLLNKQRSKNQHEAYCFGPYQSTDSFDDDDYPRLRPAPRFERFQFLSKPGLYGWQKIDRGSALLINSLPVNAISKHQSVLDLGCGYGFLALMASLRFGAAVSASDNNIAAVNACNKNFQHFGSDGSAFIGDCANTNSEHFDIVLCNPPFHSGFSTNQTLTEQFLASAKNHLNRRGHAYFVVNEFIPLKNKARPYFNSITLLNKANGFEVFCLYNT